MRGFPSCSDSFLESQLEYDISRMDLDTEKTREMHNLYTESTRGKNNIYSLHTQEIDFAN